MEVLASSGANPGRRSLGSGVWGRLGFRDRNASLCGIANEVRERFIVGVLASEM